MPKKRKLNSKNPKYLKEDNKQESVNKVFIKEVKGCKMYFIFSKENDKNAKQ